MSGTSHFTAASDLNMTQKWLSEVRTPTVSGIAKLSNTLPRMANHPQMASIGARIAQLIQPGNEIHHPLISALVGVVTNAPIHMQWFYSLMSQEAWRPVLDQHRKRIYKATWLAYELETTPEELKASLFRLAMSKPDIQKYWTQQGFKLNYAIELMPPHKYESWLTQAGDLKAKTRNSNITPLPILLCEDQLHLNLDKVKSLELLFAAAFKDGPISESRILMRQWPDRSELMLRAALSNNRVDGEWIHILKHNESQLPPTAIWLGVMLRAIDCDMNQYRYPGLKSEMECYSQWWPEEFNWIKGLRQIEKNLDIQTVSFINTNHSYDVKKFEEAGARLYAHWKGYKQQKESHVITDMELFISEI